MKIIVPVAVFLLAAPYLGQADMIKKPNVAGAFYSADPQELSKDIDAFEASTSPVPMDRQVGIALVPHAGYPFSGPVAAYTYKAVSQNHYKTIVVIGPSHFVPFAGISIWPKGAFQTPLGTVPVDEDFASKLLKESPSFKFVPQAFEREHSVEVELPFLQKTFSGFHIVPIVMGDPDPQVCYDLAVALDKLIGNRDDVLVLISSDMSHYYTYDEANRMDALTLQTIQGMDIKKFFEGNISRKIEMCGFVPMTTAMFLARMRGLDHIEVLKHANSGDVTGDKSKVVGYSSIIFYSHLLGQKDSQNVDALNADEKKQLLQIARQSIVGYVMTGKAPNVTIKGGRLNENQGAFVTISKHGPLRGCVGAIVGQGPLYKTVRDMAVAAASSDPRFPPLKAGELKDIDIEISVLSLPQRIKNISEIQLGRDGVIVSVGNHQGVFLPQVAQETGWSKEEFLSQLCSQKAGLPRDAWKDPDTALYTFTADVFAEKS